MTETAKADRAVTQVVPVETRLMDILMDRDWTIAVAESLTGGEVNARLCSSPGSGEVVLGGIVSYSTEAKRSVLQVEADHVVTAEAAMQMAAGVRDLFGADIGLSTTGVAGPATQEDQPVGTVHVGWAIGIDEGAAQLACAGTPDQIKRNATEAALQLLLDRLEDRDEA